VYVYVGGGVVYAYCDVVLLGFGASGYLNRYVFFSERSHVGLSPLEGLLVSLVCVSVPMVIVGEINYQVLRVLVVVLVAQL
jgi:hypothetical protein